MSSGRGTGELCIHDPEDPPLILSVPPGEYKLIFAQRKTDAEDFLEIDVFLIRHGYHDENSQVPSRL
jgi:hypothetical protein